MRSGLVGVFVLGSLAAAHAQPDADRRLRELEERVDRAEREAKEADARAAGAMKEVGDAASSGIVVFLYGVFCALWAQNTGRNAWLWFLAGVLFSVFAAVILLIKNSEDRQRERQRPATGPLAGAPGG